MRIPLSIPLPALSTPHGWPGLAARDGRTYCGFVEDVLPGLRTQWFIWPARGSRKGRERSEHLIYILSVLITGFVCEWQGAEVVSCNEG